MRRMISAISVAVILGTFLFTVLGILIGGIWPSEGESFVEWERD